MATPSQSPSASPSAKKKHPHATGSASPGAKVPSKTGKGAKAKATPKLAHKAGKVTPHNLGAPNFAGYCAHIGHHTAELVANNAYGWQCTSPAAAVDTTAACNFLYHVSDAVSRFAVFASPDSWQCWN